MTFESAFLGQYYHNTLVMHPVSQALEYFEYLYSQLLSHVRLCNTMNCSPPDSSIRGIILARILQWVAISFSQEDEEGSGSGSPGWLLEAWTTNTTS